MALKTFFTPKYKIFVHLISLYITIMSIVVAIEGCERRKEVSPFCTDLITTILFNITIYFLVFVLFPLLIKNWKKHIGWVIIYLAFYTFSLGWLHAVSESGVTTIKNVFSSIPIEHFDLEYTIRLFLTIIPFGILAWVYFLFVSDWEKLKTSFFKGNIERTVNIIFIALVIFYASIMPQGDSIDEVLYIIIFIVFFYINTLFIAPFLIKDKKIKKFLMVSFLWFLGMYTMFFLITYFTSDSLVKGFSTTTLFSWYYAIRIIVRLFLPLYLISFIYGYIRIKIKNQDKKLEAKESELQLLKSQVNPHFLFNTLNTLYATALE